MAVDAAEHTLLDLSEPARALQDTLRAGLPAAASTKNPIDVIGDATPDRYTHALNTVLQSKEIAGVIVLLTPQIMTDAQAIAHIVGKATTTARTKPVLASFMGGEQVQQARDILETYGIPQYDTPERAVSTMHQLIIRAQHARHTAPYTPPRFGKRLLPSSQGHCQIRTIEAEQILAHYDLPVVRSTLIATPQDCKRIKRFPIAAKVASRDIVHKAAAHAIQLNITTAAQTKQAYNHIKHAVHKVNRSAEWEGILTQPMIHPPHGSQEIIIGMKRDASFCPLIMVGLGGSFVEVFHDVAFGIAPLTVQQAKQLLQQLQAAPLLTNSAQATIARIVATISRMVTDYPEIKELDINPLIIDPAGTSPQIIDVRIMTT